MHAQTCIDENRFSTPCFCSVGRLFKEFFIEPWPATSHVTNMFQHCTAKNHQSKRERLRQRKCDQEMFCSTSASLHNFISVTGHHKQPPCFSCERTKESTSYPRNAERATWWEKKPLWCVQSRHWQLKLPPAESSALAEWTWFNPCISCHGFPFFPPIMTWEEPACWVTATRKHAENRPAMLQAATTVCLPIHAKRTTSAYWLNCFSQMTLFLSSFAPFQKHKQENKRWLLKLTANHLNNYHYTGCIMYFKCKPLSAPFLVHFMNDNGCSTWMEVDEKNMLVNSQCPYSSMCQTSIMLSNVYTAIRGRQYITLANAAQFPPQITPTWLAISVSVLPSSEGKRRLGWHRPLAPNRLF